MKRSESKQTRRIPKSEAMERVKNALRPTKDHLRGPSRSRRSIEYGGGFRCQVLTVPASF